MLNTTVNNKILVSEQCFNLYFAGIVILSIIFILLAGYNLFIKSDISNIIIIIVAILNIAVVFGTYSKIQNESKKQKISCCFSKPAKEKVNTKLEKKENVLESEKDKEAEAEEKKTKLEVYDCILDLVKRNVYFDYVNKLLYIDDNFKDLWNDYNYYDAKSYSKENRKKRDEKEKLVFQKIYELKQQEAK